MFEVIILSDRISITKYALECLRKRQDVSKKYNIPIEQILDLSLGDNLFIPPSLIQKILVKEIQSIDPRDSYPIDYFSFIDEISVMGLEYPCSSKNESIDFEIFSGRYFFCVNIPLLYSCSNEKSVYQIYATYSSYLSLKTIFL